MHCAVVQWKTLGIDGREVLHTQTKMFCSDDPHHDGAYAAHTLQSLVKEVLRTMLRFFVIFFFSLYMCVCACVCVRVCACALQY